MVLRELALVGRITSRERISIIERREVDPFPDLAIK
jgi:hypothetical protein